MDESGKRGAGDRSQSVGNPITGIQSTAAGRKHLMHFIERAVKRECNRCHGYDSPPRPFPTEPQGRHEGKSAAEKRGEVQTFVPEVKEVQLRHLGAWHR